MPVEEHEVHEKVKVGSDLRYGCNTVRRKNPRQEVYYAPDRVYRPNGTYYLILKPITDEMSKSCRSFYLWANDPACADCKEPRDTEYADKMRSL